MRCILGLCVVLAVANPAWTTETDLVSLEQAAQVPSLSQTAPTSGLPAVTAPSITNQLQAPAQPAQTTASPAPAMTNSGSPVAGTQIGATTTPNTMSPMTYYYRTGLFGRRYRVSTPMYYSSSPMYTTMGSSTPTQTSSTVPQQETFYQPVQQRRGLLGIFQPRWRQQAVPVYPTTGSITGGSANMVYMSPGYTTTGFGRRVYTPVTYYYYNVPAGTAPATTTPPGMVSSGAAPVATTPAYTPTMYTVPNSTAPAAATPSATIPSVVKPPVPTIRLPGSTSP
jgi:hypothetical protein